MRPFPDRFHALRYQAGDPCGVCRHCRKVFAGIHPDVTVVERLPNEKGKLRRELTVDQIRAVTADAYILPSEAERKVTIIRDAGDMNVSAQNAFLKLLEEPPRHAAFLLCTENPALLLPTVRSRCVLLQAGAEETLLPAEAVERAGRYLEAAASGDPAALLRCCAQMEKMDGAAAADFAEAGRRLVCDMLCGRAPAAGMTREQLMAQDKLLSRVLGYLRVHVGVRHICGLLAVQPSMQEVK